MMSSTNTDQTLLVLDTGRSRHLNSVAFHPDGKHILGADDGIRRWRLADGQQVGEQTGMDSEVLSISVSNDDKWIVCGTSKGASVWDREMEEKVINVEDENVVYAVDVSPDSTRFAAATGTPNHDASIWSITSGKRLVGPFKHDNWVSAVRFSPNGKCIATATFYSEIRIFDTHTGDNRVAIKIDLPGRVLGSLLAWSSDGQQIFATSEDGKIKCFNVSTGSLLAESQYLSDNNDLLHSIALAANGNFLATFARRSILFLDTSTLTRIGSVVEDGEGIHTISISADSSYLATGRDDGKIIIRDLSKILPDSYGPFHASADVEVRQDEHSPRSSGQPLPDPTLEDPGKHSGDNNGLLELEARPSTPAGFDFDESLSLASSALEDEIPPVGSSHVIPQSSDTPPATSIPEARVQEDLDTVVPPRSRSIFKRWLQRKGNNGPTSPKLAGPSHSPARVNTTNKEPSWMAAGQLTPRVAARSVGRRKDKPPAKASNKGASRSGQGSAGVDQAGPPQQENNSSQPSAGRVHLTHQQESGDATLSLRFPAWMFCIRSSVQDGTH